MPIKRMATAMLAATLAVSAAQAATLQSINGQVLVSRGGSGFQPVTGTTELAPGDTVIANPGGSAQVVYINGVSVEVQPGTVVEVSAVPPAPPAGGPSPPVVSQGLVDLGAIDGTTVLVGGVVVAGVAGGIVALTVGKSSSP